MKQRYRAERIKVTKHNLVVYLRVDIGSTVRWTAVSIPLGMVADNYRELMEGLETIFSKQLEADADVQYLPLEKWE